MKMYAVGIHKKHLDEVLEMSTTKDVFHGKIRKKYCFSFEKKGLIWTYVYLHLGSITCTTADKTSLSCHSIPSTQMLTIISMIRRSR